MAYLDENGALRNSDEDMRAFAEYCRERVKLFEYSKYSYFPEHLLAQWGKEFGTGAFPASAVRDGAST